MYLQIRYRVHRFKDLHVPKIQDVISRLFLGVPRGSPFNERQSATLLIHRNFLSRVLSTSGLGAQIRPTAFHLKRLLKALKFICQSKLRVFHSSRHDLYTLLPMVFAPFPFFLRGRHRHGGSA